VAGSDATGRNRREKDRLYSDNEVGEMDGKAER
jgi:hypothetical protein